MTGESREEVIKRVTGNLISMVFAEGGSMEEPEAAKTAASIEKKAYTVAQVESTTTTGTRPTDEVVKAYTRCKPLAAGCHAHLVHPSCKHETIA